jgi:hypothetical protein
MDRWIGYVAPCLGRGFSDGLGGVNLSYVKYGENTSLKNYHDYLIGKYSGYVFVKLLVKVENLYKRIAKKLFG